MMIGSCKICGREIRPHNFTQFCRRWRFVDNNFEWLDEPWLADNFCDSCISVFLRNCAVSFTKYLDNFVTNNFHEYPEYVFHRYLVQIYKRHNDDYAYFGFFRPFCYRIYGRLPCIYRSIGYEISTRLPICGHHLAMLPEEKIFKERESEERDKYWKKLDVEEKIEKCERFELIRKQRQRRDDKFFDELWT
jgi:hypothetical protein